MCIVLLHKQHNALCKLALINIYLLCMSGYFGPSGIMQKNLIMNCLVCRCHCQNCGCLQTVHLGHVYSQKPHILHIHLSQSLLPPLFHFTSICVLLGFVLTYLYYLNFYVVYELRSTWTYFHIFSPFIFIRKKIGSPTKMSRTCMEASYLTVLGVLPTTQTCIRKDM